MRAVCYRKRQMVCLAPSLLFFFAKVVSVRSAAYFFVIRCGGGGVLKGRIGNFAGTFFAIFFKKSFFLLIGKHFNEMETF